MGYSIIICQKADHRLITEHAPGSIHYATALGQRVGLATYDPDETAWLVDHVDGLLDQAGPRDVVLVADHDTIERYPNDSKLVRAEYSAADRVLTMAVRRVLSGETTAAIDLISWFWDLSRELPPAGIASLEGCIAKSGVAASQWAQARQAAHTRRALRWLSLVVPEAAEHEGYRLAAELLERADPVSMDDHRKVQEWLNVFEAPGPAAFHRYCLDDDGDGRK